MYPAICNGHRGVESLSAVLRRAVLQATSIQAFVSAHAGLRLWVSGFIIKMILLEEETDLLTCCL